MPTFQHDNISFNYIDHGKGKPLLFLHGMGGDSRQALEMLGKSKSLRLISFDYRGHGATYCSNSEADFSMEQYMKDAIAFLDHLKIEKCIVVGVSLGAAITLKVVLNAPERVRKAVFIRPAWLNQVLPNNLKEAPLISQLIAENGAEKAQLIFQEKVEYLQLMEENPNCAISANTYFLRPQAGESSLLLACLANDAPFQSLEELKKIEKACLILVCKKDPIHPYEYGEELLKHLNHAELIETAARYFEPALYLEDAKEAIEAWV